MSLLPPLQVSLPLWQLWLEVGVAGGAADEEIEAVYEVGGIASGYMYVYEVGGIASGYVYEVGGIASGYVYEVGGIASGYVYEVGGIASGYRYEVGGIASGYVTLPCSRSEFSVVCLRVTCSQASPVLGQTGKQTRKSQNNYRTSRLCCVRPAGKRSLTLQ